MQPFASHLDGFQDVADQLADHLRARAAECFRRDARDKAALTTVDAFEARRRRLRDFLRDALGGLPEMPGEVCATRTGVVQQQDFDVELLLLETLPGVLASANLYVPHRRAGRVPGVLFLCGHAHEAKAYPVYQRVCRALARAGMVVLALDPIGQGERQQYVDPETGAELVEWGTAEHAHAGLQCHVAGFGIARYFIADAMQALSYLAARPEVDAARLGVTGNSGGGTQASYLVFLDQRLACGAPCTYLTSREAYMATGQAHDSEQNVRGAVAAGLDHDDLAAGLAPRPVMLGAVASDYFCVEGALQTFARLRQVYALYGREDHLYMTVAPGPHGYSEVLRDRVTRFFRRHLLAQEVDLPRGLACYAGPEEAPLPGAAVACPTPEDAVPPERLRVTRSGQVTLDHPTARTVFHLNLEAWRHRRAETTVVDPDRRARLAAFVLGARRRPPMWVRQVRTGTEDGVWWAHRYGFSEPGIAVPMIELRTGGTGEGTPVVVAALSAGTAAVVERREAVRELLQMTGRALLFDPRGSGAAAQRPVSAAPADARFGTLYKLNYDAMMLDDSLLAMRAFDALRVLEYAHRVASAVQVAGEGVAGVPLLMAAVVDGGVSGGRFRHLPRSFADLVTERLHEADWSLEAFGLAVDLPDVPDMLAWLPGVEAEAPVDARGRVVAPAGP